MPHQASRAHAAKGRRGQHAKRSSKAAVPRQAKTGSLTSMQETSMPVFPSRTTRRVRYATTISITATNIGTVSGYVFSCNGLFDPDITSTGHQPMGFDQVMLFYNHYHVRSSKINVNFRNTAGVPINCAIRVTADTTIGTSAETFLEFGGYNTETLDAKSVSGSVKRLIESCDIKRFQGVDDIMDVTELSGTIAANPAEGSFFHVVVWDPLSTGGIVTAEVVIDYVATFSEPRILTPSQALVLRSVLTPESKTPAGRR
jgi:hypothetical protein